MEPFYTLKSLCNAFGPSTCEDEVILTIRELAGERYVYHQTPHKNLVLVPNPRPNFRRTIFLQAHMDELGFRPFRYHEDGFVELTPLGYIPPLVANHRLRFAPTNVHAILVVDQEGGKQKYYADVGACNKMEAQALIPLISNGAYVGDLEMASTLYAGKSFDDRAGCAVILQVMDEMQIANENRVVGIFTAREETGEWPTAELIQCCQKNDLWPDLILNLEVCPGGPTPLDKNPEAYVGKGVVLAHMDRYYACDHKLSHFMIDTAQKYHIHHQHMTIRSGGGEIGRLALSFGVLSYSFTIPVRYMHAPNSVMSKVDYEATIAMVKSVIVDWKGLER